MSGKIYTEVLEAPILVPRGMHRVWLCTDADGKPYLRFVSPGKANEVIVDADGNEFRGRISDLTMVRVVADLPEDVDAETFRRMYASAF